MAVEFNILDTVKLFGAAYVLLIVGAGGSNLGQDTVPAAALVDRFFTVSVRIGGQVALVLCGSAKILQ